MIQGKLSSVYAGEENYFVSCLISFVFLSFLLLVFIIYSHATSTNQDRILLFALAFSGEVGKYKNRNVKHFVSLHLSMFVAANFLFI